MDPTMRNSPLVASQVTPNIEILDERSVDRLPRPLAAPEDFARRYVASVIPTGPRYYVDNARVEMKALVVDGKVLPFLINTGRDGNAAVCSLYAHYVEYTLEELTKRNPRIPPLLFRTLMLPLSAVLKPGRIDRVVFVNNWLLPTNPSPQLSAAQIAALTARLTETYPESAIVFRSINPMADGRFAEALQANRYRLVRSRRVYMLDPANGRYLDHEDSRRDLRLLKRTPYEIVRDHDRLEPHTARLAMLYRDLYLNKHSHLNLQFNERFFALTLRERILTYRAFEKDGRVDAFMAYFVRDRVMTGAILGYDRDLPRKRGLLRLLFALMIAEAAERGLLLNMSAGADHFKLLRGAIPVEEFDAVYDRHLPTQQRCAWAVLQITTALWARARGGPLR